MTYAHAAPARSSSAAMGRRRKRRTEHVETCTTAIFAAILIY
jgi:hypothetical protein